MGGRKSFLAERREQLEALTAEKVQCGWSLVCLQGSVVG